MSRIFRALGIVPYHEQSPPDPIQLRQPWAWLTVVVWTALAVWGLWTLNSPEQWQDKGGLLLVLGLMIILSESSFADINFAKDTQITASGFISPIIIVLAGPVPAALLWGLSVALGAFFGPANQFFRFTNPLNYISTALLGGSLLLVAERHGGQGSPAYWLIVALMPLLLMVINMILLQVSGFLAGRPLDSLRSHFIFIPVYAVSSLFTVLTVWAYGQLGLLAMALLFILLILTGLISGRISVVEVMLREERDRAQQTIDAAAVMLLRLRPDLSIETINERALRLVGDQGVLADAKPWEVLNLEEDDRQRLAALAQETLDTSQETRIETKLFGGRDYLTIAWRLVPLLAGDEVVGLVLSGEDISELRQAEARIAHLAFHDALTGLPNRVQFKERLEAAIAGASQQAPLALIFMDLDGFKEINDQWGHAIGDQALQLVAQRLVSSIKSSDLVARQGGDEFLVLLEGLHADAIETEMASICRRISDAITRPLDLAETELEVGVSIGFACYPQDGSDAEALLEQADRQMYSEKRSRRRR